MINIETDTPIEYSKQSRDYQVFSFIYSALFNQSKMYIDLMKNIWTDNIDDKLLSLRSYTLNFIPKFEWENKDLLGVTNCFRYLMRTKGTKEAIKNCLFILARIKGITARNIDVKVLKGGLIQLILNEEIADIGNIDDLLRYILPAGLTYEIVKYSRFDSSVKTSIVVENKVTKVDEFNTEDLHITKNTTNDDKPTDTKIQYTIARQPGSLIDYPTGMIITDGTEKITSDDKPES